MRRQDIQNKVDDSACAAAGLGAGCVSLRLTDCVGSPNCSRSRAGGDGLSLPTDMNELFAPAYSAGVRVHSNSWGYVARHRVVLRTL